MPNSPDHGNAVDYFVDRHVREGRGDRLAFADPWRRLTYGELAAASARFACRRCATPASSASGGSRW